MQIASIGYERRDIANLIDILNANRVKKLIDVRLLPISRRNGFSKTKLSDKLKNAGIEYLHIRKAGNPFYKEAITVEECLNLYSFYLESHPDIVNLIVNEAEKKIVALFCYERELEKCHRHVLLEKIGNTHSDVEIIKIE